MAAAESSTTLEMGTSDQVLVARKRNRRLTTIIGGVVMLVVIAVVVTLVVVFSGNEGAAPPETLPLVTTEGPTTAVTTTTTPQPTFTTPIPTTTTTTTTTTTPAPPPSTPEPQPPVLPPAVIELDDLINGAYATSSFNGIWASGTEIMYRNSNGDLILYDFTTDSEVLVVQNSSEILQQSSHVTAISADNSHVVLSYNVVPVYRYSFLARYAAIDITSGNVTDIVPPGIATNDAFLQNFVWGPQGTSCAFVYLNNVYYKPSLSATPVQVSTSGQLNVIYNGIPDWVYEEEVFDSGNAIWFSNNGNSIAYATFDDTDVRVMRVPHYGVPGSLDYQYTQHHEIRYPKAGTTNPTVSVTLVDLQASSNASVFNAPTTLDQPILKTVRFVNNNNIALVWTNRVQNSLIVQLCTAGQTTCTQIFEYNEPEGWIDIIPFIFNSAGNAFITILPQAVNGVLYKEIVQVSSNPTSPWTLAARTNIAHTVIDILLWTDDDVIWYKATHVNDSAEQHIYSVDAAGNINCFTCGLVRDDGIECLFNDGTINADATLININCAGPGVPQNFFYNTTGVRVRTWDTNEEVAAALNGSLPETIRMHVPIPGAQDADVHIQVPADYANRTNVPLLVYVYGGPDTAQVTQQWSLDWGTSLISRWGIAIAHIDGRGSGLRGVSNMFALNRQLGSVEIEDQITVTRYLQENLPWLDSNRTCIWGWSYGGYAASLALARGGDVFRCAIAVAPVTDWRFYDTIYTERYMDTPQNNSVGYAESSLLTQDLVEAFRNKSYFLVHGTADDNVHFQHAMLLSRLLQRQDVAFTQMTYTDEDHGMFAVRPHLYHGFERFLQEKML